MLFGHGSTLMYIFMYMIRAAADYCKWPPPKPWFETEPNGVLQTGGTSPSLTTGGVTISRLLRSAARRRLAQSLDPTAVPISAVRVEAFGVAVNVGETASIELDGPLYLSARLAYGGGALDPVDLVGESSPEFQAVPLCLIKVTALDQLEDAVREPFKIGQIGVEAPGSVRFDTEHAVNVAHSRIRRLGFSAEPVADAKPSNGAGYSPRLLETGIEVVVESLVPLAVGPQRSVAAAIDVNGPDQIEEAVLRRR
jgi:hypothetical protein